MDITKGNFASIYLEIDLNKPLKLTIMILGRVLTIEYEGLRRICFKCGQHGHRAEAYIVNNPTSEPGLEVVKSQAGILVHREHTYNPNKPFSP